jgi:hypothetical protein
MTAHTEHLTNRFGTCIVAVRTLNEVILGADSAVFDGKNLTTVHKIITAGKFVFACAGFVADETGILDIRKITKRSLARSKNTETALRNLERIIKKKVTKAFEASTTARNARLVTGWRRHSVEIVLCSIENDIPCLAVILFDLKRSLRKIEFENIETRSTLGNTSEEAITYRAGSKVVRWRKQLTRKPSSSEAVSFVRNTIQVEIDYYSKLPENKRCVTAPIWIACMTKERTQIECYE